jgi:enoyl-CoA hydratase/carnithine racemase
MITARTFIYTEDNHIATITLNRPEKLNALTFDIYRELTDTFYALANVKHIRAVIITGRGRAFCSGGDVREIIGELIKQKPDEILQFTQLTCELVKAIRSLPKPVISSLNGLAAGGGACIALASDIRIASESARIAFLFTKIGLSAADMGVTHLLPRIIGLGRATELLFTGEFISAHKAEQIGLFNRVVSEDKLESETRYLAELLSSRSMIGLATTKEMIEKEHNMDLFSALDLEAKAQAVCMQADDFREGFYSFIEKREPKF